LAYEVNDDALLGNVT